MGQEDRISMHPRTPTTEAARVLAWLDELWADIMEVPTGDFTETVSKGMFELDDLDADKLRDFLWTQMEADGSSKKLQMQKVAFAMINIACAYCIQAIKASQANNDTEAWMHVGDAQYWLGAVTSLGGSGEKPFHIKGGDAIKAKSKAVGDFAYGLASSGNYRSKAEAVRKIKDRVMQFAKDKHNWTMSALQAESTINGWLSTRGYTPQASRRDI